MTKLFVNALYIEKGEVTIKTHETKIEFLKKYVTTQVDRIGSLLAVSYNFDEKGLRLMYNSDFDVDNLVDDYVSDSVLRQEYFNMLVFKGKAAVEPMYTFQGKWKFTKEEFKELLSDIGIAETRIILELSRVESMINRLNGSSYCLDHSDSSGLITMNEVIQLNSILPMARKTHIVKDGHSYPPMDGGKRHRCVNLEAHPYYPSFDELPYVVAAKIMTSDDDVNHSFKTCTSVSFITRKTMYTMSMYNLLNSIYAEL